MSGEGGMAGGAEDEGRGGKADLQVGGLIHDTKIRVVDLRENASAEMGLDYSVGNAYD
jgi:hypothetical protein